MRSNEEVFNALKGVNGLYSQETAEAVYQVLSEWVDDPRFDYLEQGIDIDGNAEIRNIFLPVACTWVVTMAYAAKYAWFKHKKNIPTCKEAKRLLKSECLEYMLYKYEPMVTDDGAPVEEAQAGSLADLVSIKFLTETPVKQQRFGALCNQVVLACILDEVCCNIA